MAGLYNYACDGTLVIGSVSLNCPAWMVGADADGEGGLLQLVTTFEQRGEDRLLPNAVGVIPYPRRKTKTEHELRIVVIGDVDRFGVAAADHNAQLVTNLKYLVTNVVTPPGTSTGTRAATYTPPGSSALTANVHVIALQQTSYSLATGSDGAVWEGRLFISIPAGSFA